MLRNYFQITFRNILRNKGYAVVNILGLAVGMASCVLILFYVQYELSFDTFHDNCNKIYRLICERKAPEGMLADAVSPSPFTTPFRGNWMVPLMPGCRVASIVAGRLKKKIPISIQAPFIHYCARLLIN